MTKIKLGENLQLQLEKLVETRLLIQANSGGGKSYAIRKLLEETHGRVQQIVLDIEGEFGTLREKGDYILAGKGGDVEANPDTAELLAHKVLDLKVSLIVDLYELKPKERILFVKHFLNAVVNSPKKMWHPTLIVLDEAHVFAPEKGESEALDAVIDLATRGRKRGFCLVPATQRLSKLHKDVAAECLNKMIGRTSLDIDRKRAGSELGFISDKDSLALRKLAPGAFYAFGPAISDEVVLGAIGRVQTTHPKAGQRIGFKRTKPTLKIKAALKALDNIPAEAQQESSTIETLQGEIRELKMKLRESARPPKIDPYALTAEFQKGVLSSKTDVAAMASAVSTAVAFLEKHGKELTKASADLKARFKKKSKGRKLSAPFGAPFSVDFGALESRVVSQFSEPDVRKLLKGTGQSLRDSEDPADHKLGACEKAILGWLATKPNTWFTKVQIGAMTGYRHSSGGFNNSLSKLSKLEFIKRNGGTVKLGDRDVSWYVSGTSHKLEDWVRKLGACERKIYEEVLRNPTTVFSKDTLGERTAYSPSSGGFNNALSRLSTLGLISRREGGVVLNPEISNLEF